MYRFLQYEHLPKDKLLARNIYHLWNKRLNRHIYKQLCIPRELRHKIISLQHDTRFTGHRGVHKMYEDAIRFWWNNIYKDMQNYGSSCKLCLNTNTGHSSAHFQTIHVDLLKFLTLSKGNNFILVIIIFYMRFQNLLSQKQLKRKQHVQ